MGSKITPNALADARYLKESLLKADSKPTAGRLPPYIELYIYIMYKDTSTMKRKIINPQDVINSWPITHVQKWT